MAMNTKAAFLFWMVITFFGAAVAAVYRVGDSAGWTFDVPVDYAQWASTKTFHVGDTIRFEYDRDYHDVVRVTHLQYRTCNATAPLATHHSGNDSFFLRRPTHLYFLCSVPGHCEAGMKVDIRVPSAPSPNSPSSSPSLSPTPPTQLSGARDSPMPASAAEPAVLENRAAPGIGVSGDALAVVAAFSLFFALFS